MIERVTSPSIRITHTGPMPCMECRQLVYFDGQHIVDKLTSGKTIRHQCRQRRVFLDTETAA